MAKRTNKTVLFLCTGNYYRSRFAEVLFNSVAGKMGLPWRASSRGLALEGGAGNQFRLIESALPALAPIERHGDNHVKGLFARKSTGQQLAKRRR